MQIIGREREIELLNDCLQSEKSEFVGLFGRRRVGKTFLVREALAGRITFHVTGIHGGNKRMQLTNFLAGLKSMAGGKKLPKPQSWFDAFELLRTLLNDMPKNGTKRVLFLDELPWMDTQKSGFLSALEHFWNDYAAWEHDIVLIICGSATSWIVEKIIDNHGGLHNRLTKRIHLKPFTLAETEAFIDAKGINWSRYDIVQCYMAMGGIPYYLDYIPNKGQSLSQTLDELFFKEGGVLKEEYNNLYSSLFKNSDNYIAVVKALAMKITGMTRNEIFKAANLKTNGDSIKILENLEACGFIRHFQAYGKKKKDTVYQLIDFYTLFYLRFVQHVTIPMKNYWSTRIDNPSKRAWVGYAFELVCLTHIEQIRKALGFSAVACDVSEWHSSNSDEKKKGAQIDLVIERRDNIINLCEMKFSRDVFEIDVEYESNLINKIERFAQDTQTKSALHLTMITTFGVKRNKHYGIVDSEVTLDDLFLK